MSQPRPRDRLVGLHSVKEGYTTLREAEGWLLAKIIGSPEEIRHDIQ